ncbi:hypothetical protein [Gordonia sp. N1V]|uniref:hypothetical protein n=1 Tax=Gordonia sp. N1V TaxID=3034163 RepID=UPI0023E0E8C5|nr:hypothetical protein [Gordonia sp. N1V]MDF3280910.1 hypothetical protein [Gordonia sp. N1V]
MKPSVGRIVHYTAEDGEPIAAIITMVDPAGSDDVTLTAFPPGVMPGPILDGDSSAPAAIPYAEAPTPGHWSWPPRV